MGILGQAPSPTLASTIHDKTLGVPLCVEELASALNARDLPGEAAAERMASAAHLQGSGSLSAARELVARAAPVSKLTAAASDFLYMLESELMPSDTTRKVATQTSKPI